jgi:putative transposase
MKLTIQLQLLPDPDQEAVLLATMERFNEAASFAARLGFEAGVFSQPSIHKLAYKEIRDRFGLSAQMAVRAIGKAVEAFRRDKTKCPVFKPQGAGRDSGRCGRPSQYQPDVQRLRALRDGQPQEPVRV